MGSFKLLREASECHKELSESGLPIVEHGSLRSSGLLVETPSRTALRRQLPGHLVRVDFKSGVQCARDTDI